MTPIRDVELFLVFEARKDGKAIQDDDLFSSSGKIVHCELYDVDGIPVKDVVSLTRKREAELEKKFPHPGFEVIREGIGVSKGKDAVQVVYSKYPECRWAKVQKLTPNASE